MEHVLSTAESRFSEGSDLLLIAGLTKAGLSTADSRVDEGCAIFC